MRKTRGILKGIGEMLEAGESVIVSRVRIFYDEPSTGQTIEAAKGSNTR